MTTEVEQLPAVWPLRRIMKEAWRRYRYDYITAGDFPACLRKAWHNNKRPIRSVSDDRDLFDLSFKDC